MTLATYLYDLAALERGERPHLPDTATTLRVDGPEGKHAVAVKRLATGEHVRVVDGFGGYAVVEVEDLPDRTSFVGKIVERGEEPWPTPTVTVFQAIPKAERSELTVDLLTQGGADAIIAWEAERCIAKWTGVKREKALAKWRRAAIAAAKQARRAVVPSLAGPYVRKNVAGAIADFDVVLMLHEEASVPLASVDLENAKSIALIVGPEGGLSPQETADFSYEGATAVRLGPQVLRTASAGFAALAAIGVMTPRW